MTHTHADPVRPRRADVAASYDRASAPAWTAPPPWKPCWPPPGCTRSGSGHYGSTINGNRSSYWDLATGWGANRVRLGRIDADARASVLASLKHKIDSLALADFQWEGEVICATKGTTAFE